MNNQLVEQLDRQIDALFAGSEPAPHFELAELMEVASLLRRRPRPEFRARLRDELRTCAVPNLVATSYEPPQFKLLAFAPLSRSHLAVSFALHVTLLAGVLTSGILIVGHRREVQRRLASVLTDSSLILAPSRSEAHGGGGGGDRDKLAASKGTAPRFAQDQLTPPTAVIRNESPALPVEPTLVGPDVKFPLSPENGDPMARILTPPSNGTGSGGGIGSGEGGGVGVGKGTGLGAGEGGGLGSGVFTVGGGVAAPRTLYAPDPEYSEEARKAKFQGQVVLEAVISPDGRPRDLHVIRSLGMGLDQKALEAVSRWRFAPGTRDGRPVAVRVAIEVDFRLY